MLELQTLTGNNADVTLIVRTPDGRWFVDDDGAGNLRARVLIGGAPAGRYRVWVGTYQPSSTGGFPATTVVARAE